ncbi:hypothetical protein DPMN_113065 [Dreissena polymorpha]|uniref:G-protein coupled receptors family 1 profile domain-containing protein n=1 Tax=Dreissena polymorpha TaxID=45954 RepID=A0A9D4KGW0_DREPO|nr:hypothetical protein DPMN_113065 [Dreissena polymorpha]
MEQTNASLLSQLGNTTYQPFQVIEEFTDTLIVVNKVMAIFAIIILLCDIVAVIILGQCRKIPFQCRYVSINFIISDGISNVSFLICQILIFWHGMASTFMLIIRFVTTGGTVLINMLSVACLSAERAFALLAHLTYSRSVTRPRVLIAVSGLWTLVCVTISAVTLYGFKVNCNGRFEGCNFWDATRPVRLYMMSLLLLAELGVSCSYVIIHRIAMRHKREIAALRSSAFHMNMNKVGRMSARQFSTTKTIIKIVLVFIILHSFMVINLIVHETSFEYRNTLPRKLFYAFCYLCIQLNSILSLQLYVARFEECKLKLFVILAKIFPAFESKMEKLRRDVFNIVVSADVASGSGDH